MPRVRWCTLPVLLCLTGFCWCLWIVPCRADCWYDDERHEEGVEVATVEPCLNCTCSRGTLLCYLRVCPKLPNPPPPGCILLHRYRMCCPELICTDIPGGGNSLEARSEPDGFNLDLTDDKIGLGNACIANGSIYGPGSAMDSSSLCEFCYCLAGRQTCVKPKCLLPIEGCVPMYDDNNCCPVHYNCSSPRLSSSSSTTTVKTKDVEGGCLIDGLYFPEGGKVLGVGHSVCDNCYCLRGLLRCEPLSCAPPLLGCLPVIRPGECCAASYNCSGTIEIRPEPNYGQYPTVSKEYAKLRKEVQRIRPTSKSTTRRDIITEDSSLPFYVLAETPKTTTNIHRTSGTYGTTRQFSGMSFNPSTNRPVYYSAMEKESLLANESKHSTRSYPKNKLHGTNYATTHYELPSTSYKKSARTTTGPRKDTRVNIITTPATSSDAEDYFGFAGETLFSIVDSLLDNRLNRRVETDKENDTTEITTTATEPTTISNDILSTESVLTTTDNYINEIEHFETTYDSSTQGTTDYGYSTTEDISTVNTDPPNNISYPVTVKTVLNSTDCISYNRTNADLLDRGQESNVIEITTVLPVDANEINKLAEVKEVENYLTTTGGEDILTETTTGSDDVTEVDLESRVKVGSATSRTSPKSSTEIEAILNLTKSPKDDDYGEYDYNEPSLPPSLPNLRIIPFVAADALEAKKGNADVNSLYSQETLPGEIDPFGYTLFSPPVETEGGFVPKESLVLEKKTNEINCISEGREVPHGQSVKSEAHCMTCSCYYGNMICQTSHCPIPRPECRKAPVQDHNACCPQLICDEEEAPTVVLDRSEGVAENQEPLTIAEGIVTPDPFRHVIRTEPAPDLQSLIGDMMPFLARKTTTPLPQVPTERVTKTTTIIQITTPEINLNSTGKPHDEDFSLDKVIQLLLSGETAYKTDKTTQKTETTTKEIQTIKYIEAADNTSTAAPSTNAAYHYQSAVVTQREEPLTNRHEGNTEKSVSKHPNSVESAGVGLLKLAGCNIYGRMYRVGRIISELSGPCLECKCTEVGVQCRDLKC